MSVENDGLPMDESGADFAFVDLSLRDGTHVARRVTDPMTEPLPVAPAGATADLPTQALPLEPSAGSPTPADPATQGSLEGDLFDGRPTSA
jgi:hypothetical protein